MSIALFSCKIQLSIFKISRYIGSFKNYFRLIFLMIFLITGSINQLRAQDFNMDDSISIDTSKTLTNEFSFHILPIYQIFTGYGNDYNVLFQYKHFRTLKNQAFNVALIINESSKEFIGNVSVNVDSVYLHKDFSSTRFAGLMSGYEWYNEVSPNWKVFYGISGIYLFGRDVTQEKQIRYTSDSLGVYTTDTSFKSEAKTIFSSQTHRLGIGLSGGVEYKINRNFGLSIMSINNIYYDFPKQTTPTPAEPVSSFLNFDLLRFYMMLKVYF